MSRDIFFQKYLGRATTQRKKEVQPHGTVLAKWVRWVGLAFQTQQMPDFFLIFICVFLD
jgi:hypothetical protein